MDFLQKLFGLDGRLAVVSGGASGIGAAFAKGLAGAGASIVIADVNDELGSTVVAEIQQTGGTAEFRQVDVTNVPAIEAFAEAVADAHRSVDVLVNSAGVAHRSPIEDFAEDAYERVLATNLKGTYFMSKAIGKKMLAQGKGSIINIASIGGFIAYPHSSAYLASKGGVVQVTRSFALEWIDRGVRVNAIAPGLCDTPILQRITAASGGSTTTTDFIQKRMLRAALLRPDDLVAAAIFLASDGSTKVTGHTLPVDDGYLSA